MFEERGKKEKEKPNSSRQRCRRCCVYFGCFLGNWSRNVSRVFSRVSLSLLRRRSIIEAQACLTRSGLLFSSLSLSLSLSRDSFFSGSFNSLSLFFLFFFILFSLQTITQSTVLQRGENSSKKYKSRDGMDGRIYQVCGLPSTFSLTYSTLCILWKLVI